MAKIGLALSGGGFRATLYHLGVVRFLRDAGILSQVTHITAVSGGSILAAHLVLNWNKFNGSEAECDEAAGKLLDFVRLDVRNRIVRRYPFGVAGNFFRWITRRAPNRMWTRSGLLEKYYSQRLFGETCLYELPNSPDLHLLSTNLSEGCLCSFTRDGLIMQRRLPGDKLEFERIAAGLATVSLAVASSSAFPGFFPPISIKAQDIGASELAFTQQAFTDGGVFDNLGVRAFRFIERCWGEDCNWGEAATREVQTEQLKGVDAGRLPSGAGGAEESRKFHEDFGRTAQLPSAPPTSGGFAAIITSDAGGKFMVNRQGGGGGLVRTAMRSSDILMDRVWQLEKEIVGAAPGFLFVPIAQVVEASEDPHALAPVVQRQVTTVRTDLDRFSDVEIRSLAKHGYAVARRACRLRPDLFPNLPSGPPWDPVPHRHGGRIEKLRSAAARIIPARAMASPTVTARELQRSADRRVWGTLIDAQDAMTYAFIPLLALILATLPYLLWKFYSSTVSQHAVLETIAESSADQRQLIDLLRSAPPTALSAIPIIDVAKLDAASPTGFEMLTDFHIVDLRAANQAPSMLPLIDGPKRIYEYRHLRVRRLDEAGDGHLRLQYETQTDDFAISVDEAEFQPRLRKSSNGARGPYRWELDLNFSKISPGNTAGVTIRRLLPAGASPWHVNASSISHLSYGETQLATMWLLLPEEEPNVRLQLVATEVDRNGVRSQRRITPDQEFRARNGAVLGWQLLDPPPGLYECHWVWR